MSRIAYGVKLTTKKRKTEGRRDTVNFDIFINHDEYYVGRDSHGSPLTKPRMYEAKAMSEDCANALAAKLNQNAVPIKAEVVKLLVEDEVYVVQSTAELGEAPSQAPVVQKESTGLQQLREAVEQCFRDGLGQLDILAAANKAVLIGS
jgi:hypothetical protein